MWHRLHRPSNRLKDSRGSVTAELAIAMPAVSLVIAITLGAFALQIERMKLVDVAATAARAIARGEPEAQVSDLVSQMLEVGNQHKIEFSMLEKLACVKLSKDVQIPGLGAKVFALAETQCARKMGL
jgi:hypothetical protein